MLISITLNVCLHAHAMSCRRERIDFMGSPLACVVAMQPLVAEWNETHPDWRVSSWTCRSS